MWLTDCDMVLQNKVCQAGNSYFPDFAQWVIPLSGVFTFDSSFKGVGGLPWDLAFSALLLLCRGGFFWGVRLWLPYDKLRFSVHTVSNPDLETSALILISSSTRTFVLCILRHCSLSKRRQKHQHFWRDEPWKLSSLAGYNSFVTLRTWACWDAQLRAKALDLGAALSEQGSKVDDGAMCL